MWFRNLIYHFMVKKCLIVSSLAGFSFDISTDVVFPLEYDDERQLEKKKKLYLPWCELQMVTDESVYGRRTSLR